VLGFDLGAYHRTGKDWCWINIGNHCLHSW